MNPILLFKQEHARIQSTFSWLSAMILIKMTDVLYYQFIIIVIFQPMVSLSIVSSLRGKHLIILPTQVRKTVQLI